MILLVPSWNDAKCVGEAENCENDPLTDSSHRIVPWAKTVTANKRDSDTEQRIFFMANQPRIQGRFFRRQTTSIVAPARASANVLGSGMVWTKKSRR